MSSDHRPPADLEALLLKKGLISSEDVFEPLYGGRTNKVWKLSGETDDCVLKVYRTGFHNPLFRNDPKLEAICLQKLAGTKLAPRLRAAGETEEINWVLYDHAPGQPWTANPILVAQLLRRLHRHETDIAAPTGSNGSADLKLQGQKILNSCTGPEKEELQQLTPFNDVGPLRRLFLIHGDPVPGNILVDDERALLIDWQCPVMGDPAEDLAIFLSPAMQWLYRGNTLTEEEETAFLTAYRNPEVVERYTRLRPWFHWRMAAYCLWRTQLGTDDYVEGWQLEKQALLKLCNL